MTDLFDYFEQYLKLSEPAKSALAQICSDQFIKKNEILQDFAHTCRTIYFMRSGIARIFYYKDGKDITEYFAFEGEIIARVESLFTGKPSQKAIQVLQDSHITAIDATQLFRLYDDFPEIERLFRLIMEAGYVDTVNRMESLQFHTAEERYLALMKENRIIRNIPLKHIASYLGITPVSLSRIRSGIK